MVNLKLTKMQIQEILVWAGHYRTMLKEIRMGFDKDEIELHLKIFRTTGLPDEEFYARYPEKEGYYEGMVRKLTPSSSPSLKAGVSEGAD